jgi:hypothetical protein
MNRKFNWVRRSRNNAAQNAIPVRFDPAPSFEIHIKRSRRNTILDLDPPLVPKIDGMQARAAGRQTLRILLSPFNRGVRAPAMAAVTLLDELHLDERRLEAVLKNARKKRC